MMVLPHAAAPTAKQPRCKRGPSGGDAYLRDGGSPASDVALPVGSREGASADVSALRHAMAPQLLLEAFPDEDWRAVGE